MLDAIGYGSVDELMDAAIPSVIALRQFVRPSEFPAFTRFNVFLRDRFSCQYCGNEQHLTFDHVTPRRLGGRTTWENILTACAPCNMRKGGRTPQEAGMKLIKKPVRPKRRRRGFPAMTGSAPRPRPRIRRRRSGLPPPKRETTPLLLPRWRRPAIERWIRTGLSRSTTWPAWGS